VPAKTAAASDARRRCPWCLGSPEYVRYHDREWGRAGARSRDPACGDATAQARVRPRSKPARTHPLRVAPTPSGRRHRSAVRGCPIHDDRLLFEFLILEGAQAGLAWSTILAKRYGYRQAFEGFDAERMARYGARDIRRLMDNAAIVRNRLKIEAAVANARATLRLRERHGSLDAYVWRFVDGRPVQNRWRTLRQVPSRTDVSDALSRDLRQYGFRFVGSTIC
jgi:DNA-3-methyladenine glycosylase I